MTTETTNSQHPLLLALEQTIALLEAGDAEAAALIIEAVATHYHPACGLTLPDDVLQRAQALLGRCAQAERKARATVQTALSAAGTSRRAGAAYGP